MESRNPYTALCAQLSRSLPNQWIFQNWASSFRRQHFLPKVQLARLILLDMRTTQLSTWQSQHEPIQCVPLLDTHWRSPSTLSWIIVISVVLLLIFLFLFGRFNDHFFFAEYVSLAIWFYFDCEIREVHDSPAPSRGARDLTETQDTDIPDDFTLVGLRSIQKKMDIRYTYLFIKKCK